jgi:hypothetical protein
MSERNIWPGILLTLFIIGLLVWLIAQARQGDPIAIAVLAVLGSVILILVGWGFSTLTNALNAMLLKQARETPKALPAGDPLDIDALMMDDSIFDELEE